MTIGFETLIKISDSEKKMLACRLFGVRVFKPRFFTCKVYPENWKSPSSPKVKMIPFSTPLTGDRWTNEQFGEFLRAAEKAEAGISRYSTTHYDYIRSHDYNDYHNILKSLKESL